MKRKHNIINSLYLTPEELEKTVLDRYKRYEVLENEHTEAETYLTEDAEILVAAYGATARVAKSAVIKAREAGVKAGLIRPITLWPFPKKEIAKSSENAKHILVTEMNMGQMVDDVKLAVQCRVPVSFFGRTGGMVPKPSEILDKILELGGAK